MEEKLIVCDKNIGFGMPILRGRRLTVYNIVTKLYYEDSIKESIEDYDISIVDAKAAVEYCMNLNCKTDADRIHFCDGCILRTLHENEKFNQEEYIEIDEQLTSPKDNSFIYLGNLNELEDDKFGKLGWAIAGEVYPKLIEV